MTEGRLTYLHSELTDVPSLHTVLRGEGIGVTKNHRYHPYQVLFNLAINDVELLNRLLDLTREAIWNFSFDPKHFDEHVQTQTFNLFNLAATLGAPRILADAVYDANKRNATDLMLYLNNKDIHNSIPLEIHEHTMTSIYRALVCNQKRKRDQKNVSSYEVLLPFWSQLFMSEFNPNTEYPFMNNTAIGYQGIIFSPLTDQPIDSGIANLVQFAHYARGEKGIKRSHNGFRFSVEQLPDEHTLNNTIDRCLGITAHYFDIPSEKLLNSVQNGNEGNQELPHAQALVTERIQLGNYKNYMRP